MKQLLQLFDGLKYRALLAEIQRQQQQQHRQQQQLQQEHHEKLRFEIFFTFEVSFTFPKISKYFFLPKRQSDTKIYI